ncbi:MAG: glycosyltransferase family 4 protein [Smithellaceae bacterium]
MRILLLTQWFQPEVMLKGLPFAKALAARGHDVEVLTGFPNYPGGKIYSGYRLRLYAKEIMQGVLVHRVWLYPSHDRSALRRILNYCSFALSALLIAPWVVRNKPDVVYVYNLVTLGLSAFILRRLWGCRVVMDIQDLWPESVAGSGMLNKPFLLSRLTRFCNWVYQKADGLAVLSPGFEKILTGRGVPQKNIDVIYNWCDEESLQSVAPGGALTKDPRLAGKFTVLFAGTMGVLQGLDTVLATAKLCAERLPDVRFLLVGGGTEKQRLEEKAARMKLDNVIFLPFRNPGEMGEVFAAADALLVHLKDEPVFRVTIPSKTQAYLYAGKPVIMAVRGDAACLIEKSQGGVVCAPEDPEALARAIGALFQMPAEQRRGMGQKGRDFYLGNLSLSCGVARFDRLFSQRKDHNLA